MPTQPRPIHSSHNQIRDTPDETEPSYSYEETSFLAQKEDDVEDEFHRRFLASTNHHPYNSRLSGGSANSLPGGGNSGGVNGTAANSTRGSSGSMDVNPAAGRSSFWRTEATPQWQARGTSNTSGGNGDKRGGSKGAAVASMQPATNNTKPSQKSRKVGGVMGRLIGGGRNTSSGAPAGGFPKKDSLPKRERKTSGGLLGAAMQLHSQGNKNAANDTNRRNSNEESQEVSLLDGQLSFFVLVAVEVAGFRYSNFFFSNLFQQAGTTGAAHAPPRKMSSSMSQNSLSSADGKGNKKDLSRQRAEARRLKMDAQIHDVDIGRLDTALDDGIPTSIGAPSPLMEEDEGGATTDGDSTTASNHFNPSAFPVGGVNPRYSHRMAAAIPGGEKDIPPVATISTAPLNDSTQSHHDNGDNRSIAESTVGSDHDGVSTVSGSGKSLLYGKGPASPAHQPTNPGPAMDQNTRSSIDGSMNVDQSTRSTGLGAGVLFGKSSSLIFPTGVVDTGAAASVAPSTATNTSVGGFGPGNGSQRNNVELKSHKVNLLLDQCETVRFPFKKKLMLNSLDLTAADIPIKDLYGTNLGNSLHKLSLAGNRLSTVPPKLVVCLPILKSLDLSQCELHQLPERWNLPLLKRLNLSHNRLTDFPEEV